MYFTYFVTSCQDEYDVSFQEKMEKGGFFIKYIFIPYQTDIQTVLLQKENFDFQRKVRYMHSCIFRS